MSSAGDPLWEALSVPVKAAVRWAWASAFARTCSWDAEIDSLDLLTGVLLADLTGNPARILFEHFGISPGEVLQREHAAPPTAKVLRTAVETPPPGLPRLDRDTQMLLDSAYNRRHANGELITLPELFGAQIGWDNEASVAIDTALAARGTRLSEVVNEYWTYLGGRQPFREFLRNRFPYQAPRVALADYLADRPDEPIDLVGIGPEVDAFAHLIAARRLVPPLAIGMFGDWGSGKSYFLRSLQRRITRISQAELPDFHKSIVQVEFNAWQYVGGDLWASLVEHLFRNLRISGDDSDDLIAQRQQFWVEQVQAAGDAHVSAQEARQELETERDAAANAVKDRERDLKDAADKLARAQRPNPSEALKNAVRAAAQTAGFTEVIDNAAKLRDELDQARTDLRSLLTPLRNWRYWLFAVVTLVATPFIALLTRQFDLSAVSTVAWLLGTAASYIALAGRYIRSARQKIADAQAELAAAEREEHQRIESEVQAAQAKLDTVQSQLDSALLQERELSAKFDEVKREQEAATPGQVLTDFINERLGSEDYRRHLGVPALVRRDLERLSRLVAAQETTPSVPGQYAINRIVLYIDDLDRCPTPMVIKVLEAVHLLLAFPIFVVVVAVDARWLTSSLRDYYQQLAGHDASPEDYLEKIFQVTFRIQPLPPAVRERMLRGLLVPSLVAAGDRAPVKAGEEVDLPETDVGEFNEVVASFARISGNQQALSEAVDLTITSAELAQAQDLAGLIGSTPRAVKRFVNVYLLVKSIGTGRGWDVPGDGRLVILLAIAVGLPRLADVLFPRLANASGPLTGVLPTPSDEDSSGVLREWVRANAARDVDIAGLTGWVDLIGRFRHTGAGAGRMDG